MAKTVFKLYTRATQALEFSDEDIISLEWEQQSTRDHSTVIYDLYSVYGTVVLQDKNLVLYNKAINGEFDQYDYPIELFINNTKVGAFVVTQLPSYSYADKSLTLSFGDKLSIADTAIYSGYDYPQTKKNLDVIFKAVLKAFDKSLTDSNIDTILTQSIFSKTQTFAQYLQEIYIPYPYIKTGLSFREAFRQILTVAQAALVADADIGYRLIRMDGNKSLAEENSIAILSDKTTSQLVPTIILPNKYNVCEIATKKVEDIFYADEPFWSKENMGGSLGYSHSEENEEYYAESKSDALESTNDTLTESIFKAWTAVLIILSDTDTIVPNTITIPKKINQGIRRLVNVLGLPETQITATAHYSNITETFNCASEGYKYLTGSESQEGFLKEGVVGVDGKILDVSVNRSYWGWNAYNKKDSVSDDFKIKMPISSIKNKEYVKVEAWDEQNVPGLNNSGYFPSVIFPEKEIAIEGTYTNTINVTEDDDNVYLELKLRYAHSYDVFVVNCVRNESGNRPYNARRAIRKKNNPIGCTLTVQYNADFYELNFNDNTLRQYTKLYRYSLGLNILYNSGSADTTTGQTRVHASSGENSYFYIDLSTTFDKTHEGLTKDELFWLAQDKGEIYASAPRTCTYSYSSTTTSWNALYQVNGMLFTIDSNGNKILRLFGRAINDTTGDVPNNIDLIYEDNGIVVNPSLSGEYTPTKENKVSISSGGTLMQYPNSDTPTKIASNTLVTFEDGLNGGTLECTAWDYYSFKADSEGKHEKMINYLTLTASSATLKYKKFFAIGDMVVPCKDRNYTPIMTRTSNDGTKTPVYFQVVKNSITFNGGSFSQQLTLREVK